MLRLFFLKSLEAFQDDLFGDLAINVQLDNEFDVSEHALLLAVPDLSFVEHEQHLLVEIVLQELLYSAHGIGLRLMAGFVVDCQTCPARSCLLLLLFELHLVELLLALGDKELFEVELVVLLVVELLEEQYAESHVLHEEGVFGGGLHENNFLRGVKKSGAYHQFVE